MRNFWVAFLPLAGTVGTLAALGAAGIGEPSLLVLGAALCLTRARRTEAGSLLADLTRLPLVAIATAGIGLVFARSLPVGDALYLAVFAGARLAWRLGPTSGAVGRALLLPLVALFIAPPVALADRPLVGVGQVVLACVVATLWTALLPRLWPPPAPSIAPLAAAARRSLRNPRHRVGPVALALDARLPPNATEARLAVLAVEHAVARRDGVEEALDKAAAALATLPPAEPEDAAEVSEQSAAMRARVQTRLTLQSTVAVALAFLAGQQLFGHHWPWTVITVLAVSLRATSRGEVAVTAAERLLGAAAGTVVATAAGALAMPGPVPGTVLILAVLAAGMLLRPYSYAYWAAAMTASLSLLYGLLGEPSGLPVLGARLLAILVGGACAVLPAALLAPVRTRAAVRRRVGAALRTLGGGLREGLTVQNTRAADRALDLLRRRSRPLRLSARLRPTDEARWARTLIDCGPPLHAALLDPSAGTRRPLAAAVRTVAAEVTGG